MSLDEDKVITDDHILSEWEKRRYRHGPGEPELPPQLREMRGKTADEAAAELKKLPFFMTELDESEPNELVEALQALAYDGEPHEVCENFKFQGNECFRANKFKDAIEFYTKGLEAQCTVDALNVACFINRAACNLALKNYRKCINDCKLALKIDAKNIKALYRSATAYAAVDRNDEAIDCIEYALSLDESQAMRDLLEKCKKRKSQLAELDKKRAAQVELKRTMARNLELAIASRNYSLYQSTNMRKGAEGDLQIKLEDAMDATSDLLVPVLCLYPLEMESDLVQPQTDNALISDYVNMMFETAPQWFAKSESHPKDYQVDNLEVYVQTAAGGLAKAPKKSSIRKVLGMKAPVLPVIDQTARLYIVPKNRAKQFLESWNKDASAKQIRPVVD